MLISFFILNTVTSIIYTALKLVREIGSGLTSWNFTLGRCFALTLLNGSLKCHFLKRGNENTLRLSSKNDTLKTKVFSEPIIKDLHL